jgi:hypothetical protein
VIDAWQYHRGFVGVAKAFEASTRDRREHLDSVAQFVFSLCAANQRGWQKSAAFSWFDAEAATLSHYLVLPVLQVHHGTFEDGHSALLLCLAQGCQANAR